MRRLGRVLQFEIPFRCVFDSGVGLIWSGAFAALYYKFPGGSVTVSDGLCPATRSDRGSNSWATLYATVTKPIAGTGHRFGICDAARWGRNVSTGAGGGRYDSQNAWEWVEVSAETVEQFAKPKGRSDYCGGNNGGTSLEGQLNLGYNRLRQDELVYLSRLPVACGGRTDYKFSSPRSSLMLVSALIRQRLLALYQDAIASGYRFTPSGMRC